MSDSKPEVDFVDRPIPPKKKPSIDFLMAYVTERTKILLRLHEIDDVLKENRQVLVDHYIQNAPEGRMKDIFIELENDCGLTP